MRSGSGHSARSVMRPNCTPPAYERIDSPRPTLPVVGTQNMLWRNCAPQKDSGCPGPGTLVITAVVLREKRARMASCAGLASSPASASTP
ncbi:hypothetical protein MASR1M6_29020 [Rubrivivax sp.]